MPRPRPTLAGIPGSAMASKVSAASATLALIGPTVSSVAESGKTPAPGTRPRVGFRPTTPHQAAGLRIEPPVSVPSAVRRRPAATATAEPEDEPPVIRSGSHGFTAGGAGPSKVGP